MNRNRFRERKPTYEDLEFENGKLVKVNGARHNYMNGDELITLVGILAEMLKAEKDANKKSDNLKAHFKKYEIDL